MLEAKVILLFWFKKRKKEKKKKHSDCWIGRGLEREVLLKFLTLLSPAEC